MKQNKKKNKIFELLNLGNIVFLVIVIYIAAYSLNYLGKHKLATYQVTKSDISDTIKATGVIVRDEELVKAKEKGYISYYKQDNTRVKTGGIVYLSDATGKIQKYMSNLKDDSNSVSNVNKDKVYEELRSFTANYKDINFHMVYEAKMDIQRRLTAYTDSLLSSHKDDIIKELGKDSCIEVRTDSAGIICYSSDNHEDIEVMEIRRDFFKQNIKMKDLRTSEEVEEDTPIYRIVKGQKWRLVIPITEDEYNRLERRYNKNIYTIPVNITKDNFETTARYKTKVRDDGYYVVLIFDNYVQRYINQRFLTLQMKLSQTDGLKIPSTSLVNRKVYKIPVNLLYTGSNSNVANQVNIMKTKKGNPGLEQMTVTVFRKDKEYAWIDADSLKHGMVISDLDMVNTVTLESKTDIQGVFLVNRGFAEFKAIQILESTTDYCIISPEDDIQLYDRIILNSDTIKENEVIY